MDTTITMQGSHRPLGFGTAFARQFRLLWASRRPLFLLIGLLAILMLGGEPWTDSPVARFFRAWPVWLLLIGPVWAFVVWHNEGPSTRHYFWSQPVDRMQHTMARVTAGLAWLWLVLGLFTLIGLTVAAFDGQVAQFGHITVTAWVNLFTGALLGYLIVSVLTVPSDYPARWLLGILFLVPMTLVALVEWLNVDQTVMARIVEPLANRDWGLGVAWTGPWLRDVIVLDNVVRGQTPRELPVLTSWWWAMPLWVLLWTAIVTFAANRHPGAAHYGAGAGNLLPRRPRQGD